MLAFYGRIAKRLHRATGAFRVVAYAGIVSFIALIFMPEFEAGPSYAFLSATIALWSVFLIVVVNGFAAPIPIVEPSMGIFARIKIKLRRAGLLVSAVVLTVMAAVILSFTFRAVASLIGH